jgi:hypothetical protein
MKDWGPFLTACGVLVAMLSFWAGAVTVTGVAPGTAPHGIIEYWFNRYQTVIAAFIAFSAALFVVWQIRETRKQHRANIRLALRNELEAVESAEMFGEHMLKAADDNRHDVAAALLNIPPTRTFTKMEADRLARIEQLSGDAVSYFVRRLISEIEAYEQFRDAGSVVTRDIFGEQTPSATERINKVYEAALNTVEISRLRRLQLESYWS